MDQITVDFWREEARYAKRMLYAAIAANIVLYLVAVGVCLWQFS
jgi:hypothetical protein